MVSVLAFGGSSKTKALTFWVTSLGTSILCEYMLVWSNSQYVIPGVMPTALFGWFSNSDGGSTSMQGQECARWKRKKQLGLCGTGGDYRQASQGVCFPIEKSGISKKGLNVKGGIFRIIELWNS